MIGWAAGSRSSTVGTPLPRAWAIRGVQAVTTREAVACQTPWTSASIFWGRLCLSQDRCQAHTQEQPQHPGPEGWQRTQVVDHLAQAHNLATGDSRATIHDGGLLPEVF